MARGVRGSGKSIEKRIEEIDDKILGYNEKISHLKDKRNELVEAQNKAEYEVVLKIIIDSGLTPDELKELIASRVK